MGFAEAIRAAATPLHLEQDSTVDVSGTGRDALVDTCGTGGDASGTFNISTATAFVVAGAGVRVAKHGNRSVTSKCGSADVMEALGVNIDLSPQRVAACLNQLGIAFLFAPAMHSAMKHVQAARRELRLRTVFNLLGPLTNPAHASAQVVGVYSAELVEKLAEALSMLGLRRALVVHGADGLDEITITGITRIAEVRDGQVHSYEVTPEEFGIDASTDRCDLRRRCRRKCRDHSWNSGWSQVSAPRRRAPKCCCGAGCSRSRESPRRRRTHGSARNRFRCRQAKVDGPGGFHSVLIFTLSSLVPLPSSAVRSAEGGSFHVRQFFRCSSPG